MAKKEPGALIGDAKRWLRRVCSRARQSLPRGERARLSAAATRRLLSAPEYRRAKTLATFVSFGSEIDTRALIERAWKDGKRVLIPVCNQGFERSYFAPYHRGDALIATAHGPSELVEKRDAAPLSSIDLVVVPGLAFDDRLHRLGYGGGVYDRLLAKTKRAAHLGLFFEIQQLDRLPVSKHDVALRAIATEKRILRGSRH
jgi:5-formyltetrahydrofolate cyclo-ligase